MKTIRIIDLLNKIANGDEVPEMIEYDYYRLTYDKHTQDYYNEPICTYSLFNNIHFKLNDEIEIIEDTPKEDKKIKRLNMSETHYMIDHTEIMKKINEIIDIINKGE